MVFRRRDRRPLWRVAAEGLWPKGGWARAFEYVRHRLRRLPDSPEKIGRGMAVGAFVSFTPFYGFHFVVAFVLARLVRGNALASIIGTFVNNFLTLVPIGALAVGLGYYLLGMPLEAGMLEDLGHLFAEAGVDLWHNALAPFTARTADWSELGPFYAKVFLPYLVGGLAPGLVSGAVAYAVTVPLVRAYQTGRRKALAERLARLRAPDDPP